MNHDGKAWTAYKKFIRRVSCVDALPQTRFRAQWRSGAAACLAIVAHSQAITVLGDVGGGSGKVEFRAAGVIGIYREGDKSTDRAFNFEVFVRDNRWLIRTEPFDFRTNKTSAPMENYQAGTDGINVYSAALLNTAYDKRRGQENALKQLKEQEGELALSGDNPQGLSSTRDLIATITKSLSAPRPRVAPQNQAVGAIDIGVIPKYSETDLIAPIWLALCSRSVIGIIGTNLVPALFLQRDGSVAPSLELFIDAKVKNSTAFPFLPEVIGFSNRIVWLPKAENYPIPKPQLNNLSPPILTALYEASLKDFGGIVLPSAFEIRRYSSPIENANPNLRYTIIGKITNLSHVVELSDFLPHLSVVAAVGDNRHFDKEVNSSVLVLTKTNEWPTVEAVRGTKAYSQARDKTVRAKSNIARSRTVVLFSIAAISILVAVLAWKVRTQEWNNPQNKRSNT